MARPAQIDDWDSILEPGERILWQGRPDGRVPWADLDLTRAAFGVVIMAFAIFWVGAALQAAPPVPFNVIVLLFGAFFFAQGAAFAGGQLLWQAYQRRHSWYSLSSRRAFIATDLLGRRRLQSYPITPEMPLRLIDGSPGHIWFTTRHRATKRGSRSVPQGFSHLPEARTVYDLMRKLQRDSVPTTED